MYNNYKEKAIFIIIDISETINYFPNMFAFQTQVE